MELNRRSTRSPRLPRLLHPAAWWLWALGLAAAATATTNPLVLLLILAVASVVVAARGTSANGLPGFRLYLLLGAAVIAVRVVFRLLLGGGIGATVLVTLPEITLPEAAASIRIGGPVTAEGIVAALGDGLRLATLIVCVGAANVLADPRRLLRSAPGALYEIGTTVVVALSIAPQLVESVGRVRRARRLRGDERTGVRALRATLVPVMEDALDRSLALAAAMDARGYGRTTGVPRTRRHRVAVLLLGGLIAVAIGTYGSLDGTVPPLLGAPTLLLGAALCVLGLRMAGRQVARSVYRPQPWRLPEWLVTGSGVLAAAVALAVSRIDISGMFPSTNPLQWPVVPPLVGVALLAAAAPAILAPALPGPARRRATSLATAAPVVRR